MTEDPRAKIERILSEGNDFKFGDYISQGFAILQKNLGGFIGFAAIFIVLSMVIGLIPFIGSFANSLVVTPALTAGAYLVARKLDRGEGTEFGDFFKGFDFTAQLALGALVTILFTLISLVPFGIAVERFIGGRCRTTRHAATGRRRRSSRGCPFVGGRRRAARRRVRRCVVAT